MTTESHSLVDILPAAPEGTFYNDRVGETEAVEALRQGFLVIQCSVEMAYYLPLLKTRLQLTDTNPTYSDWARLRKHLQDYMQAHIEDLALPHFLEDAPVPLVRLGEAGERPDVHALLERARAGDEALDDGRFPAQSAESESEG